MILTVRPALTDSRIIATIKTHVRSSRCVSISDIVGIIEKGMKKSK